MSSATASSDVDALESELASRSDWDSDAPVVIARAPGRLDVMGGIADYSGSLVLELPLKEAVAVGLQRTGGRVISIETSGREPFTMSLDDLLEKGEPRTYESARAFFRRDPDRAWAAYVAGAFLVLMRETGAALGEGARILIRSSVPEGKGVASSAAVEVAAMMAIDGAYELRLDPRDVALLCQMVENYVVGAPCGVMDPMTSVFGEENRLLALLCQPAELLDSVAVPEELSFWGIDSGIAHAVGGADYGSVRVGAFMGYRILREAAGRAWGGYLANVTPSELEQEYGEHLPEAMSGREFLERFGTWDDGATAIDPSLTYRVRQPTCHPVYEHFRLRSFARLLANGGLENAELLGELMVQSHESYSACGLGSEGTDRLVALARESGPSRGIYGAKITGGGSGGTVAILGRRDAGDAVREIAGRYRGETGRPARIFAGSSSGARAFGRRIWKRG